MKPEKKAARKEANRKRKAEKAESRKQFMAMLGRTVVEKEVPTGNQTEDGKPEMKKVLEFPPYIKTALDGSPIPYRGQAQHPPRLTFVGGKTYKQQGLSRKNRPGELKLHEEAIVEDASRSFAKAVDSVLNPPVEPVVPVVPVDAAELAAQI